jgi:hypothetical protein
MKFWRNLIGYQIVWFSAVIGAGHGLWWPGVVAACLFATAHFSIGMHAPSSRAIDLRLLVVALVCGLLLDGSLALSGLARYAAADPALPSNGAPLWILSMWAAFALTLRHSMTFLLHKPLLAAAFGGIGGPLAYLGAARGWQAVAFAEPGSMAICALAVGWACAIVLLTSLATRWSSASATPSIIANGSVR